MSKGSRLLILLLLLTALAACRQSAAPATETPTLVLSWPGDHESIAVGPATLGIIVLDLAGRPVDDATVTVRGDMTHAGMQPVTATATPMGNGTYQAEFDWTMAGDWILTVTATTPDGRRVVQEFPATAAP
jgi:nitrogen fixation protein FixH